MLIFFSLIIALIADRILGFKSEPYVVRWFAGYVAYMHHFCKANPWLSAPGREILLIIVMLAPLVLGIYLGCKILSFSGLTHFIVVLGLIWMALGTIDASTIVQIHKSGDLSVFKPLLAESGEKLNLDSDESVAHLVLWQALQSTFGVIFWLILLGPLFALIYLFLSLLSTRDISSVLNVALRNAALKLHGIIDWLPARVYAFTLALIGNGQEGIELWWKKIFAKNHKLVTLCGMQGLIQTDNTQTLPQLALDRVNRSLFAWLLVIFIISLVRVF